MDLPATALEMIVKFMDGESFADVMLPTAHSYYDKVEGDYVGNKEGDVNLVVETEAQEEQILRGVGLLLSGALVLGLIYYGYQQKR